MTSPWLLSLLAIGYVGFLFAVAFYGDRYSVYTARPTLRPYIYSLSLGVYCTSWTFFGAVGTAVRDGWQYLPIYLGPALVLLLALPFLRKLVRVSQANNVATIADFMASRFGKSRSLAVLVTLIAFTAAVPYLALQYKAVAASIAVLTNTAATSPPWYRDTALAVSMLMALFAVLFGARRIDASAHREGLMLAIAFESLLKLLAFVSVGVYALWHLRGQPFMLPAGLSRASTLFNANAGATTLLAAAAIFCLPRQFQVGVVECASADDLRKATWVTPAYLALFSLFVVPVVALGALTDGVRAHDADTLILALPMSHHAPFLAVLVFLGGLSAATAMVVVASIALATMISNDIAVPLLWSQRLERGASLGRRVLWLRRAVIGGLAVLAFTYYRSTAEATSLAAIGVLSFAAVAQFAPGILAALYWEGATRAGVYWGMFAGFLVWAYELLLPNLAAGGIFPESAFAALTSLPVSPPHWSGGSSFIVGIAPGAMTALSVNVVILVVVSLRRGATLQERLAARAFMSPRPPGGIFPLIAARIGDIEDVAARIVGAPAARVAVADYAAQAQRTVADPSDAADRGLLQHFERVLAGSIGASSARVVLTHALARKGLDIGDVADLLDETSQELHFSRQLLQTTMENVTQGISVVDADMRIVAWNRRYLEMLGFPPGLVQVGRPVADVIRWSASRGELGPGDPEAQVEKRLSYMRAGSSYEFQRVRTDGRVYSIHGQPMQGGGFVTTYSDITDFKRTEQALLEAKQGLEERVEQRTRELKAALDAQRSAKLQAEEANASKTRFVAAASHDLLQPLNAARLFASALESQVAERPELADLAERIDGSMRAAEELLKDLLDVARLDTGVLTPEVSVVSVREILDDLLRQYAPIAAARELRLAVVPTRLWVRSDRALLRRILQNYVSNALRYTKQGGIVMGCRRRSGLVELCVYDTGPGIPEGDRARLYAEFNRAETSSPWGERGVGLGLAICERFARLLGHTLTLSTRPGHGSLFGVLVPVASAGPAEQVASTELAGDPSRLDGMRVLCVDNDTSILDAMCALLSRWGTDVRTARNSTEALEIVRAESVDVALLDYHLSEVTHGLELAGAIRAIRADVAVGLLTADRDPAVIRAARDAEVPVLNKPLRPAALRALLSSFNRRRRGSGGEPD